MHKTKYQLRDEIKELLRRSHDNGEGPHGRTIWAVMRKVERIMSNISISLIKKAEK